MTIALPSSRVVLIEDRGEKRTKPVAVPLRRYRLARLRFEGRSREPGARFEHLGRVYD